MSLNPHCKAHQISGFVFENSKNSIQALHPSLQHKAEYSQSCPQSPLAKDQGSTHPTNPLQRRQVILNQKGHQAVVVYLPKMKMTRPT